MQDLQSVEQEWKDLHDACVRTGGKMSQVQYSEMRRAFYAGYLSCLAAMHRIGEPDVSEEQAHTFLDKRDKELRAYRDDLLKQVKKDAYKRQ